MKKASLILGLIMPFAAHPQSVKSSGNGNANIGVNNGRVVVKNTLHLDQATERALRKLAGTESWQGVLYPGSGKTDYGACQPDDSSHPSSQTPPEGLSSGSYVIKLGSSTAICSNLPCSLVQVDHIDVLSLVKLNHSVGIQGQFRAADGDMNAVINGNTWHVNEREAWYIERPDTHSMRVLDRRNDEILWVSLINRHYVAVRGKFRFSDGRLAVQVKDSIVEIPAEQGRMSGFCAVDVGSALNVSSSLGAEGGSPSH